MSLPILFKNNKVARGSQGFVGQSSRNMALRVEQPSVLNKFFHNSGVRAESLRVGSEEYAKFRHFLAHPVV